MFSSEISRKMEEEERIGEETISFYENERKKIDNSSLSEEQKLLAHSKLDEDLRNDCDTC